MGSSLVTIRVAPKSQGYSRKREPHLRCGGGGTAVPNPWRQTPHKMTRAGVTGDVAEFTDGSLQAGAPTPSMIRDVIEFRRSGVAGRLVSELDVPVVDWRAAMCHASRHDGVRTRTSLAPLNLLDEHDHFEQLHTDTLATSIDFQSIVHELAAAQDIIYGPPSRCTPIQP